MGRRRVSAEDGNVILELALAVTIFGLVMLPALTTVSTLANQRRWAEIAAKSSSRVWANAVVGDRLNAARLAANDVIAASHVSMTVRFVCDLACTDARATLTSIATVATGLPFPREVSAASSTMRDAYAP